MGVAATQFGSLIFGFRIVLLANFSRSLQCAPFIKVPLFVFSSSFLSQHPPTTRTISLRLLSTNTTRHHPQQRPSINKHIPHHTSIQKQAIMSDGTESTFSAGETKLLISIIKNLAGDLQVCLRSGTSLLRTLPIPISSLVESTRMRRSCHELYTHLFSSTCSDVAWCNLHPHFLSLPFHLHVHLSVFLILPSAY